VWRASPALEGGTTPTLSYVDLQRTLTEALARESTTGEILRVISSSPTDMQPVLEAVVQNASRLCGTGNVSLYRVEGSLMRRVAEHGPSLTTLQIGETRPITRRTVSGRAIVDRATIYLPDYQAADAAREFPDVRRERRGRAWGLTLCRKFIELHGGKIWVTSQVVFTFTIPP
jgi:hypothetical protein